MPAREPEEKMPERVRELVKELESPELSRRKNAVVELGKIGHPAAVPHLAKLLEDPDLAWRATVALTKIKDPAALPHLARALRFVYRPTVKRAAEEIIKRKDPSVIPYVAQALKAENEAIKRTAFSVLDRLQHPKALSYLVNHLRENPADKDQVIYTMSQIRYPHAVRLLAGMLKGAEPKTRADIANALGNTQQPQAFSHLVKLLKDENTNVRKWAAASLARSGKPAIPHLIEALKDEQSEVREQAYRSLVGQIGRPAIPALLHEIRTKKPASTAEAAAAVARLIERCEVRGGKYPHMTEIQLVLPYFHRNRDGNVTEPSQLIARALHATLNNQVTEKNARLYVKQLRALQGSLK